MSVLVMVAACTVLAMLTACAPDSASTPVSAAAAPSAKHFTGVGDEACYFWGHQPDVSGDWDRASGMVHFKNGEVQSFVQLNGWDAEMHPVQMRSKMTPRISPGAETQVLADGTRVIRVNFGNSWHFKPGSGVTEVHIVGLAKPVAFNTSCGTDEAEAGAGTSR